MPRGHRRFLIPYVLNRVFFCVPAESVRAHRCRSRRSRLPAPRIPGRSVPLAPLRTMAVKVEVRRPLREERAGTVCFGRHALGLSLASNSSPRAVAFDVSWPGRSAMVLTQGRQPDDFRPGRFGRNAAVRRVSHSASFAGSARSAERETPAVLPPSLPLPRGRRPPVGPPEGERSAGDVFRSNGNSKRRRSLSCSSRPTKAAS